MAFPLKSNFRRGMALHAIPAAWLNWVSNFFNTCTWIGFIVTLTSNGRGCSIRTDGVTETITLERDWIGSDEVELEFEDGRLITVTDV